MSRLDGRIQVAVYQKEKKDEAYCGDSYFCLETESEFVCAIADGLGSGKFAKESSEVVINTIKNNIHKSEDELVKKCSKALVGKRGVVLGILKIDFNARKYTYSSIGNIGVMTITDGKKKRFIPDAGYLAGYERPFKVVQDKLENGMNFIMFSDGVTNAELSKMYVLAKDVDEVIKTYTCTSDKVRADDTTLIAIRYTD